MSKKISAEQVERIADLSRIGLSEEEKQKFQEDLGSVLNYIDKLQKVDVSGVDAIANITGLHNQVREDENGSSHADSQMLMDMAPNKKDGYVKVRQVLTK
ncbi:MAG: Asp-tRNA(Asn)/Glu-tRNA(Gln) amidotransferase subunit GatC [Candidatus Spechtbacteria bacterium]|nr:Asp-tRNA(Asn)/Glu-tRNA(Gln) amidotransferase subunit GatC [Candidatus Spechtbacteria bacterium]